MTGFRAADLGASGDADGPGVTFDNISATASGMVARGLGG